MYTQPQNNRHEYPENGLPDNPKFEEYHKENPSIYNVFKWLALESIRMGHKHFSARGLFQIARWKMGGKQKSDGFKYNNNYTPYYVRMFDLEFPEHNDFFEKRPVKQSF